MYSLENCHSHICFSQDGEWFSLCVLCDPSFDFYFWNLPAYLPATAIPLDFYCCCFDTGMFSCRYLLGRGWVALIHLAACAESPP